MDLPAGFAHGPGSGDVPVGAGPGLVGGFPEFVHLALGVVEGLFVYLSGGDLLAQDGGQGLVRIAGALDALGYDILSVGSS